MHERVHPLELRAMDWTFRWLASCYIDEKFKDGDEKTRKIIDGFQKSCAEGLKRCYEDMKKEPASFSNHWLYQAVEKVNKEKANESDIERAKKLLKSKGYDVRAKKLKN